MKVLIVCNRNYSNPYVSTLADGLVEYGCDVVCSVDEFWNNPLNYDIVHIQWPNVLANNIGYNGIQLKYILRNLKEKRIPVVVTLHNLIPHYNDDLQMLLTYKLIYENANCIIHLGNASVDLMKKKWSNINAIHVVIPHHIYDTLYDMNVSKMESRKKLGIPQNSKCILCFGAFRDDEERNIVINLCKKMNGRYYFLVPRFYEGVIIRKNIFQGLKALCKTIKYFIFARKYNLHMSHQFISDNDLPLYLSSADVLLVQRLRILNSGNVPLAMLAGLPIVGPDVGNVGWFLKKTGNMSFNINHLDELPNIVRNALEQKELGLRNEKYAKKNLTTKIIAQKTKNIYEMMICRTVNS